jgi:signal transduction histidine kinase
VGCGAIGTTPMRTRRRKACIQLRHATTGPTVVTAASAAPVAALAVPASAVVVAVVAAIVWRWAPRRTALLAALPGVISLGVTAALLPYGDGGTYVSAWTLVETAGLLVLIVRLVRRERPVTATLVGLLLAAAVACGLLRTLPPPQLSAGAAAMCLFWATLAAAAAVAGGYLRSNDAQRIRSVQRARREQRLALAADLHDFVAHEVSGMLFQAQAAKWIASDDPEQMRTAMDRIEKAGQRALSTLDRTVRMLRDEETAPHLGWADIRALAHRHSAAGLAPVEVRFDPRIENGSGDWPSELTAVAYRVAMEALTNVRRHATQAAAVTVEVACLPECDPPAARVSVTNDASPTRDLAGRAPGSGLATLAERVDEVGGTFEAGPTGSGRWRVTAVLPAPAEVRKGWAT